MLHFFGQFEHGAISTIEMSRLQIRSNVTLRVSLSAFDAKRCVTRPIHSAACFKNRLCFRSPNVNTSRAFYYKMSSAPAVKLSAINRLASLRVSSQLLVCTGDDYFRLLQPTLLIKEIKCVIQIYLAVLFLLL